jgi:hypothetical protein
MAYDVIRQLKGKAGGAQVKNAQIGLTENMGGPASIVAIGIYGNP